MFPCSSFSLLPKSHSLNPLPCALIDNPNPTNAPPITPPGVNIAPSKPIFPTNAAVKTPPEAPSIDIPNFVLPSLASPSPLCIFFAMPLNLSSSPCRPSSLLPNKKSLNPLDLRSNDVPIPNTAPAIGPPTRAPRAPPDFVNIIFLRNPNAAPPTSKFLLSFTKCCTLFEIIPPSRSPVSSSFSPYKNVWNLSDFLRKPVIVPIANPPIGPPIKLPIKLPFINAPTLSPTSEPVIVSGSLSINIFFAFSAVSS